MYGGRIKEISGGERRTTNNRMELTAAIEALRRLEGTVPGPALYGQRLSRQLF